jgi:hypothetical protein
LKFIGETRKTLSKIRQIKILGSFGMENKVLRLKPCRKYLYGESGKIPLLVTVFKYVFLSAPLAAEQVGGEKMKGL